MGHDPYGSGAVPWRTRAARLVAEARRLTRLDAKNDPDFGRLPNDASAILAARHYVVPPATPPRPVNDASAVLAERVFGRNRSGAGRGSPLNIPWTMVQRAGAGEFEAGTMTGNLVVKGGVFKDGAIFREPNEGMVLRASPGAVHDFLLTNAANAILAVPTGTANVVIPVGSLRVQDKFGCNGQPAQAAVAVGGAVAGISGSAGAAYTATEQTMLNDLAAAMAAHATLINNLRAALIANGIAA